MVVMAQLTLGVIIVLIVRVVIRIGDREGW
jgi:hypothetical protein